MLNHFTEDLTAFVDRLNELNYYQFFIKALLKRANNTMVRDLQFYDKNGWNKKGYMFGSGVPMADIFHTGSAIIRCPTKARITVAEDVHQMSEEIERQFNAYMVVLLFEATEAYLRSVYEKFLVQMGAAVTLKHTAAFHKAFTGWDKRAGTSEYLQRYATFVCQRDCRPAVDDFEEHLDWPRAQIIGCFGMSYHDFIRVLGTCRHCIVHNHGRISAEHYAKLSEEQTDFANSWIWETLHGKERLLLPPTKRVDNCFEHLASYGRGLYVLLSDRCGVPDETPYFRPKTHVTAEAGTDSSDASGDASAP